MATIGPWSGSAPAEPSKVASPDAKTPPSALASRYPLPSGVATPENTGEFSGWGRFGASGSRCRSRSCRRRCRRGPARSPPPAATALRHVAVATMARRDHRRERDARQGRRPRPAPGDASAPPWRSLRIRARHPIVHARSLAKGAEGLRPGYELPAQRLCSHDAARELTCGQRNQRPHRRLKSGPGPWAVPTGLTAEWGHEPRIHRRTSRHLRRPDRPGRRRPRRTRSSASRPLRWRSATTSTACPTPSR